jgi:hypothetical protein
LLVGSEGKGHLRLSLRRHSNFSHAYHRPHPFWHHLQPSMR